jgi:exopolyphosphatase / guanosine-5'-triphosphate,3'-diphosphate pyrophosphatase
MVKIGIIDIGSNSMRMVVLRFRPDGSFKLIDEVKESVRLGENESGQKKGPFTLSDNKINYTLETLSFFMDLSKALSVDKIICVATEAVRRAANRTDLIEKAKSELGLDIRILTGKEEAYYDYVGAVNTLNLSDCLIMDIGGSSTELIRVEDSVVAHSISLPFGAISISQMFDLKNTVDEQTKKKMYRYINERFENLSWIYGAGPLIGIGGSFRNIAKIDRKLKNYPLDIAHNYPMPAEMLFDISEQLNKLSLEERKKVKGLSKERADIIPGALAEITVLLEMTGTPKLLVSGSGLREGIFYDWMLQGKNPVRDVLSFSLQNVMSNYEINQNHARHVWEIVQQLYSQMMDKLSIDAGCEKILKTAALLHDSGINISYYDHHRHSFYKILHSRVNGLSQKELVMAAWVASLHRKDDVKIEGPYRTILSNEEVITIQKLGVLLQIAECLDRRQNGNVYKVQTGFNGDTVAVKITAKVRPGLEIKDAQNAVPKFRKIFKRSLSFEMTNFENIAAE